MRKIAIITSHPIQYNAPFFRLLANAGFAVIRVFYTLGQKEQDMYDPGFGLVRKWDIDLFSGYDFEFVENDSKNPGTHHFMGIVNPGLSNRLDDFSPDAVLIYGWNFYSHLKILQTYHRKAILLFRGDSTLLGEGRGFSLKKTIRKLFLKWAYRNVTYALSPGKASDAYFKSAGVDPKSIIRVPHSIDNSRFNKVANHCLDYRTELGIAEEAMVFLFSGKLTKQKDPVTLIKAFIRLRASLSVAHLVFVGSGDLEESLRELKEENDLGHYVHFLGFMNQSEIPKIYAMSDVLILPSLGETWGLVVNEAMAAGIPVIASDLCGASSDMISEGINGFTFKAGSETDLLDKMQKISKLNLTLFKNAAIKTSEMFSYDVAVQSVKSIPF